MYGRAPQTISAERLSLAVDAIETFHDHNQNESSVPLMTFWSQVFNQSTNTWQSTPSNLRYFVDGLEDNLEKIASTLRFLGVKKVAELIEKLRAIGGGLSGAFEIPPDFDDTYLNIGLGVQLKLLQDKYPSIYQRWLETNSNMKKLIELTTKYAYRPSSQYTDENTIDTRTYFWLRDFVRDNPQAIIATTWAQDITEVRDLAHRGVRMPFNLNNVDVTVGANVLYGLTSAIIYDLPNFKENFNEEIQVTHPLLFRRVLIRARSLFHWTVFLRTYRA